AGEQAERAAHPGGDGGPEGGGHDQEAFLPGGNHRRGEVLHRDLPACGRVAGLRELPQRPQGFPAHELQARGRDGRRRAAHRDEVNPASTRKDQRMTPEQVGLVQSTWARVVPIKDTAAELFYGRLFELDPSLRSLFKGDMKEQGRKLMAMINVAVSALDRIDTLVPAVKDLGRRHVAYGVKAADYGTVATALLWTLEKGLGDAFTPAAKEAWTATYLVLAKTMQEAEAEAMQPA